MKRLSGLIVIAMAIATFAHVNAVPHGDALMKMLAESETRMESKTEGEGDASDESVMWYPQVPQFQGNGISTRNCHDNFFEDNPILVDLQKFKSDFNLEIDCSERCTDLKIETGFATGKLTSRICNYPFYRKRFHLHTCLHIHN